MHSPLHLQLDCSIITVFHLKCVVFAECHLKFAHLFTTHKKPDECVTSPLSFLCFPSPVLTITAYPATFFFLILYLCLFSLLCFSSLFLLHPSICPLSLSPPSLRVWLACVVYVPSRCSVDLCCHLPDYLPDSLSLFSNVQSIIIN